MAGRKGTEYGDLLIQALNEALAVHRGEAKPARVRRHYLTAREAGAAPPPVYNAARIRSLRRGLKLSQAVFASMLNVSVASVRAWEQGVRVPDGPSRRLLEVAERHPEALLEKLAS